MGSILTLGYSACSPSHPDVADSATIKEAWNEFPIRRILHVLRFGGFMVRQRLLVKELLQIWRHISVLV